MKAIRNLKIHDDLIYSIATIVNDIYDKSKNIETSEKQTTILLALSASVAYFINEFSHEKSEERLKDTCDKIFQSIWDNLSLKGKYNDLSV